MSLIEVEVVEINFFRDDTVLEGKDGKIYHVETRMPDGGPMVLEWFHNIIFPASKDGVLGVETEFSMRN